MSSYGPAARCPACGASRLEEASPTVLRCQHCGALLDRHLRLLPPIQGGEADQTWVEPPGALPAPAEPTRGSFAAPPPRAAGPFAAPPPKDAFDRDAQKRPWSRAVGDGGPPPGLDLLVLILAGLDILSIALWARSNAPIAGFYMVPLGLSLLVVYFFWQGRNWARFLLMTGALLELTIGGLAMIAVRRYMTAPEMLVVGAKLLLDAYFLWFCVRPDTVSFFEKRSGRVGAKR